MPQPKYSEAELRAFLGLPPDGSDDAGRLEATPNDDELRMVDDLLRGRADWLKG